jgi:hypothetical protein
MISFIKLNITCIILATVFSAEVSIHPIGKEDPIRITYHRSSPVPIIHDQGENFHIGNIIFGPPSFTGYNWQEGNIAITIMGNSEKFPFVVYDIPQSDLSNLFTFFVKYYHVETKQTTLYFSEKGAHEKDFDFRHDWEAGDKLRKYLYQEQALYAYLLVLLDCERYQKKGLGEMNFLGTAVDPLLLVEILNNKCRYAQEVATNLIKGTSELLEDLINEIFDGDDGEESKDRAELGMYLLVQAVKDEIKDKQSSLLFLA